MPDREQVGLRDRASERERTIHTQGCHCSVNNGLILDGLIVEGVLNDGHQCRQGGGVRGQRVAGPVLHECEGVIGIVRELQQVRDIQHR